MVDPSIVNYNSRVAPDFNIAPIDIIKRPALMYEPYSEDA